MSKDKFNGWVYGEDREPKPTITIDVKYFYKDFSEPDRDLEGILCKSKWYTFRIHEMPRFEDDIGKLTVEEKKFTLHSKAAWEYLPQNYYMLGEEYIIKLKKMIKRMLLCRVERLVRDDFELQMVEQDMKNDYHIKFNFVEIVDPKDELP